MNPILKKASPFLLIVIGFFLLFYMEMAIPAGVCFLLGIIMIIEQIWPEKWES